MGQKSPPGSLLPASELHALDGSSQQPRWGRGSGRAASLAQQDDALPQTALRNRAGCREVASASRHG